MTSNARSFTLSPFQLPRFGLADRRLDLLAWLFLAAMVPAFIGLVLDDRELRGVNVWVKPLKFMSAAALLALTTSWLARHLPEEVRRGRSYNRMVWTLIATSVFEVAYISLQSALGQGSHYNVTDPVRLVMFVLMGLGAVTLTATQPWLAWLLWRHGDRQLPSPYWHAVQLGLVLTFILGGGVGAMLGNLQPAGGPGLPVVGWSRIGGDLRVAHFIGIHAEQILPVAGLLLAGWAARAPGRSALALAGIWGLACALTAAWGFAVMSALQGRPLVPL